MGSNVLRRNFSYLKRCDGPDHKPTHSLYVVQLGSYTYGFHSSQEVADAQKNYEEKIKAGFPQKPNPPLTSQEPDDMISSQSDDGIEKY